MQRKHLALAFIILTLHLLLLSNIKYTAWPEMLLWPYLMLKGWLPYRDIAIAHNPLLLVVLSFFYQFFGIGVVQLKIFTWLIIFGVGLATFYVTKKLWDVKAALFSLCIVIPLSIYYDANGLWFDLALEFIYPLIYFAVKQKNYIKVGILWGMAFLTKQTAVWLLLPILMNQLNSTTNLNSFRQGLTNKNLIFNFERFLTGVFIIVVPFLLILFSLGILDDYSFWAFKFAGGALPFSEGQINFPSLKQFLLAAVPFIGGVIIILSGKNKISKELLLWSVFSSFGVYPRWELFHLLPSIGFLAMLYSSELLMLLENKKFQTKQKMAFSAVLFLIFGIVIKKVNTEWETETRFYENEVIEVSTSLQNKLGTEDKIFVLNSWDNFYVYTNSIPATKPWVPQFSWYLNQPGITEEMLSDLISEKPKYVIYHPYSDSGLDAFRPEKLADYVDRYYYKLEDYENFDIYKRR